MIFLPEFQVQPTSNIKNVLTKTVKVSRTDNTFTATGNRVNLVKAALPADTTLLDINVYSPVGSNAATSANLYVGVILPFTSITSTTTTATVTTPVLHNLQTGDTIVVNGTGVANFDQATPVSITVTGVTTFTYTITSTNATSVLGAIGVTSYYFQQPLSVLNSAQIVLSVGGSPYSYTAPSVGTVVIAGGTVSAITLKSLNGTAVNIGVTSGPISVYAGQVVTVTYSVAPTMTFIPGEKSGVGQLPVVLQRAGTTTSTYVSPYAYPSAAIGWKQVASINPTTGEPFLLPQGLDVEVFAMYKETGTASTSGGDWNVIFYYVR